MKSVKVQFTIKKDCEKEFIKHTMVNVECSRKEPGVKDFLFFQKTEESQVFYLIEVYNTPEDQLMHRDREHYTTWKQNILPLLEQPYTIEELKYL